MGFESSCRFHVRACKCLVRGLSVCSGVPTEGDCRVQGHAEHVRKVSVESAEHEPLGVFSPQSCGASGSNWKQPSVGTYFRHVQLIARLPADSMCCLVHNTVHNVPAAEAFALHPRLPLRQIAGRRPPTQTSRQHLGAPQGQPGLGHTAFAVGVVWFLSVQIWRWLTAGLRLLVLAECGSG